MGFTTSIKFNKVESISPIKEITFGSIGPLCIELKVIWTGRVRGRDQKKKSPQSGTSWEELVATRQTVRHCACKGALSSGRRRICYTILAEKAVPSCVALGHGVNVCPPNLETGGENREKWYIRCTTILSHMYTYVYARARNHGVCRGCVSGVRVAKKLRVICTIRVV